MTTQKQEEDVYYAGLANLGNTCFLNSFVQILNHIYELDNIYDVVFKQHKKKNPETEFFKSWIKLHEQMKNTIDVIVPDDFVKNVQKLAHIKNMDLFTGTLQNDIHEFIIFVIQNIHSSISRKIKIEITGNPENETDNLAISCYNMLQKVCSEEYSEIIDLFYGIYVSNIHSVETPIQLLSTNPEPFFILDLPIPIVTPQINTPQINIYDCIDLFMEKETLQGQNAWFNEKTGKKENIKKGIEFWSFPNILLISFKRFSPCGKFKRNEHIDFPHHLDLSKYVIGYNPNKYKYDLFGVCNHFGNNQGGHYTSFVYDSFNEWHHYNDTNVETGISPTRIVTSFAYCLFYRMTMSKK